MYQCIIIFRSFSINHFYVGSLVASRKLNGRSRLYPLQLRQKTGRSRADQLRLVRRGHVSAEGGGHAEERGQGGGLRGEEFINEGFIHTVIIHKNTS